MGSFPVASVWEVRRMVGYSLWVVSKFNLTHCRLQFPVFVRYRAQSCSANLFDNIADFLQRGLLCIQPPFLESQSIIGVVRSRFA